MDTGGSNEKPSWQPDEGFWGNISSIISGWRDNIVESISGVLATAVNSLVNVIQNIVNWLQTLSTNISNGFSNFVSSISVLKDSVIAKIIDIFNSIVTLPSKIGDKLNELFNPNYDGAFSLKDLLADKFLFVTQFEEAIGSINITGEPVHFTAGEGMLKIDINGKILEPYIPKLRMGISCIFYVSLFLACWRNISNVLGMSVGTGVNIATGNSKGKIGGGE